MFHMTDFFGFEIERHITDLLHKSTKLNSRPDLSRYTHATVVSVRFGPVLREKKTSESKNIQDCRNYKLLILSLPF